VLIQGHGKDQLQHKTGGPVELDHLYDDELLLSAFSNYSALDIKTYTVEVDEGAGHKWMSALVSFVAQKR